MKVLVTGAAGFIGSRLCEALESHGHEVVGIDDLSTGRLANYPAVVVADICDGLPEGPFDLIYHCAASYRDRHEWERDARTNLLGTINVLRLARRDKARLVYFQTSLCYGFSGPNAVHVDAPLDPRGSYAVSKTAAELYIRDSGVDYVSLRLANVYGPRNLSGPIPIFYQRLCEGLPCTVVDSRRDYVYVDDLVWLAVRAGSSGHGVYHVSSGRDISIAELYDAVGAALGIEVPEPVRVARGPDDVPSILLDPARTERHFGWTAQTPLATGIGRAVGWYRVNGVTETYTHLAMRG